jgi:glycosyltransferase involved in cell wall biosynthesis
VAIGAPARAVVAAPAAVADAVQVSVLILTLNEEANLDGCLDSVAWCDDIVVVDSGSSDRTTQIATARGARVVRRDFDNYANQRNFALRDIQYKHAWVLMLDADERVVEDLRVEIATAVRDAGADTAMFQFRRKDHLYGRWIRASSGYPTWFGRLVRLGRIWVERPINEEYHTEGTIRRLQAHLHHFPFNKGFAEWFRKHDRYSSMEAQLLVDGSAPRAGFKALFGGDAVQRRKAFKALLYTVPGRPLIVFLSLYVLRGGFLEGQAGLTFSLLRSWYEYMIDCKRRELRRRRNGLTL